jgi:SIT4-associating protein SAP185/190
MFWRFGGYANISTLDTILEKPDVTLEELLDESDLIQELKQHNTKLIEFLRDEKVLRRLLEYVIAPKPAPLPPRVPKKDGHSDDEGEDEGDRMALEAEREKSEKARLKYAYVACEVLSSEAWSLLESLMQNIDHLRTFWSFLERSPPLDPLQASYFTKVNEVLLDKKTEEMMAFIKSLNGIVPRILKHVDCPMIMDLLLKIISMEKCEGGAGIVDVRHRGADVWRPRC